jgi:hypothetical protein
MPSPWTGPSESETMVYNARSSPVGKYERRVYFRWNDVKAEF